MIGTDAVRQYFTRLPETPEIQNFMNHLYLNLSDRVYLRTITELANGSFTIESLIDGVVTVNDDSVNQVIELLKNEPSAQTASNLFHSIISDKAFSLYRNNQDMDEIPSAVSWNSREFYDSTSYITVLEIDETETQSDKFHNTVEIRDAFSQLKIDYPAILQKINEVMNHDMAPRIPKLIDSVSFAFENAFCFYETNAILSGFRSNQFLKTLLNKSYRFGSSISVYNNLSREIAADIATRAFANSITVDEATVLHFMELYEGVTPFVMWSEFYEAFNSQTFFRDFDLMKAKYYYSPQTTSFFKTQEIIDSANSHKAEIDKAMDVLDLMSDALLELHRHTHLIQINREG